MCLFCDIILKYNFLLNCCRQMIEIFTRHRLKILVLFQGVILCVTHPWMEGNTAFWQNHFDCFSVFLCILMLHPYTALSEGIISLPESSNKRSLAVALSSRLLSPKNSFFIGAVQHNTPI